MFTNARSSFGDHLLQRPARLEWDHFLACTTQNFVIPIGTDGIKVTSHILEARHHDPAHVRRSMHSSKQEMHSIDRTERLNTIRLRAGKHRTGQVYACSTWHTNHCMYSLTFQCFDVINHDGAEQIPVDRPKLCVIQRKCEITANATSYTEQRRWVKDKLYNTPDTAKLPAPIAALLHQ